MSKFQYIKYPFFGRYTVPKVNISFNNIQVELKASKKLLKTRNTSSYLENLSEIDSLSPSTRLRFSVTAQDTQQLIMLKKRCVWGIDNAGVMHNLLRKEQFKSMSLQVENITKDKYLWFPKITYPFLMPLSIKNIREDLMCYWFRFLYIDNVWEIYRIETEVNYSSYEWI